MAATASGSSRVFARDLIRRTVLVETDTNGHPRAHHFLNQATGDHLLQSGQVSVVQ